MGRKVVPSSESEAESNGYTFTAVGRKLVVTPKDRISFDACLDMTGLASERSKIAYFEIDESGIRVAGRKLSRTFVPWMAAED